MKAAFVKVPFTFEIRDIKLREPNSNEVLVRIKACGLCGTDLHYAKVLAEDWQPFGHEIVGIAEKVGANVSHVKEGDYVLLESGSFCRECDTCRNGRVDLCNKGPNFWTEASMGFAEYVVASKECLVPFSGISFEEASLIEPLGVALDLFYTTDIKLNDDVLVVGLGPIGLMALRLARAAGARRIYAAARSGSEARIELAKRFGADEIVYTDKINLEDYSYDRKGVDKVMVTAPPKTIPPSLKAANTGGTVAFLGIEYGAGATITFDANEFHFKKLQLRASYAAPALYFPRCVELIKSGVIDAKAMISHRFKLDDIAGAMTTFRDDKANTVKMVMLND